MCASDDVEWQTFEKICVIIMVFRVSLGDGSAGVLLCGSIIANTRTTVYDWWCRIKQACMAFQQVS